MSLRLAAAKVVMATEKMLQESGSPIDLQVFQRAVRDGGEGLSVAYHGDVCFLSHDGRAFLCGLEETVCQIAGAIRTLGQDNDN